MLIIDVDFHLTINDAAGEADCQCLCWWLKGNCWCRSLMLSLMLEMLIADADADGWFLIADADCCCWSLMLIADCWCLIADAGCWCWCWSLMLKMLIANADADGWSFADCWCWCWDWCWLLMLVLMLIADADCWCWSLRMKLIVDTFLGVRKVTHQILTGRPTKITTLITQ